MNVDDLAAGAHTPHDGWCDPNGLSWGFRRKAVELGAVYVKDRVVAAEVDGSAGYKAYPGCKPCARFSLTTLDSRFRGNDEVALARE